jgi:hypothetical protein
MKAALSSETCVDCAKALPYNKNRKGTRCRSCAPRHIAALNFPPKPIPADFVKNASAMARAALKEHYGASDGQIRRWAIESGVFGLNITHMTEAEKVQIVELGATLTPAQIEQKTGRKASTIKLLLKERGVRVIRNLSSPLRSSGQRRALNIQPTNLTDFGALLRELSKKDGCPVYECDEAGKLKQYGGFVRYGNSVKTPEEIEAKCRRKGLLV